MSNFQLWKSVQTFSLSWWNKIITFVQPNITSLISLLPKAFHLIWENTFICASMMPRGQFYMAAAHVLETTRKGYTLSQLEDLWKYLPLQWWTLLFLFMRNRAMLRIKWYSVNCGHYESRCHFSHIFKCLWSTGIVDKTHKSVRARRQWIYPKASQGIDLQYLTCFLPQEITSGFHFRQLL